MNTAVRVEVLGGYKKPNKPKRGNHEKRRLAGTGSGFSFIRREGLDK